MAQPLPPRAWSANLNLDALNVLTNRRQEQQQRVIDAFHNADVHQFPQDDEFDNDRTDLFAKMQENNAFIRYTGLPVHIIDSIYQTAQEFAPRFHRRGPRPKINNLDALLLLLTLFKSGGTMDACATQFGINATTFRETIKRIRPIIHLALKSRWNPENHRPKPLDDAEFANVALLVDSTSTQIYKPSRSYNESKPYWDAKNAIYALKKEVAVMATAPHYALFAQRAYRGAVHDFTIFKENYQAYLPYLVKTPAERQANNRDRDQEAWTVVADKAYYTVNEQLETPGVRRITAKKKPKTLAEKARNDKINKIRVPVECFFGRMQRKWAISEGKYRLDHEHFDQDFEICMFLTNEEIKYGEELGQEDYNYYIMVYNARLITEKEKSKKRGDSQKKYYSKKKLKTARHISLTVNNNIL